MLKSIQLRLSMLLLLVVFVIALTLATGPAQGIKSTQHIVLPPNDEEAIGDAAIQDTESPQQIASPLSSLISPLVRLEDLTVPVDELRVMAFDEMSRILVGEPITQHEYLLTKGQWFTYHGFNMPESVVPDRNTPMYVLRIQGELNHPSPADRLPPDTIQIVVDVEERRVFASTIGPSIGIPIVDVNIVDQGYPEPLSPEIIEAHQFNDLPEPAEDEQEPLPVPDAPNE